MSDIFPVSHLTHHALGPPGTELVLTVPGSPHGAWHPGTQLDTLTQAAWELTMLSEQTVSKELTQLSGCLVGNSALYHD